MLEELQKSLGELQLLERLNHWLRRCSVVRMIPICNADPRLFPETGKIKGRIEQSEMSFRAVHRHPSWLVLGRGKEHH